MRPPPAPQQNELSRLRGISTSSQAERRAATSRGAVVHAVVSAQVAGIVVRDSALERPRGDAALAQQLDQQLAVVHAPASCRRSAGYSLRSVLYVCGSLVRIRSNWQAEIVAMLCSASDAEEPLLAHPAHVVARRALGVEEDAEVDSGGLQDAARAAG